MLILGCSLTRVVQAQTAIGDANIGAAVTSWATNPAVAAATYGPISGWNTAAVTNMASLFSNKPTFNENIASWNVASASTMYQVFYGASAFNQDVSSWNTASVKTMYQACSFCGFVP
jgi:surface protein